ncbi:MAG: hypothetical protein L6R37_007522 [Teloschistes peruensis]|nr:MAG: hypothetical protein L6R37_007522 [Teloschistes peruensis]
MEYSDQWSLPYIAAADKVTSIYAEAVYQIYRPVNFTRDLICAVIVNIHATYRYTAYQVYYWPATYLKYLLYTHIIHPFNTFSNQITAFYTIYTHTPIQALRFWTAELCDPNHPLQRFCAFVIKIYLLLIDFRDFIRVILGLVEGMIGWMINSSLFVQQNPTLFAIGIALLGSLVWVRCSSPARKMVGKDGKKSGATKEEGWVNDWVRENEHTTDSSVANAIIGHRSNLAHLCRIVIQKVREEVYPDLNIRIEPRRYPSDRHPKICSGKTDLGLKLQDRTSYAVIRSHSREMGVDVFSVYERIVM